MSGTHISAIEAILTESAPAPAGHYAQAKVFGGMVYVSGQLPVRRNGEHGHEAPFDEQAQQAIDNLLAVVSAAGSSPQRVLKVTAYIVDVKNWPRFNTIYAAAFGDARPARSVVPVPELHHGYLVEIDAIAAIDPH
ncbi:MAG: RidA family protein [Betaproteobacteria bacterium]